MPRNWSLAKAYPAMELNTTAQMTRNTIIKAVFRYRFMKGREAMASLKLSVIHWAGKNVGGICILSGTDLELVRIIHTKGKIMMIAPTTRAR